MDGDGSGVILLLGVVFIGSVVVYAVRNTIQEHRDESLTSQDVAIREANLSARCQAVGKRGDRLYMAGPCGPNRRSGVLAIVVKGLPKSVSLGDTYDHGKYVGRCELLDASRNELIGGGSSLHTKPTQIDLPFNGEGQLKLPGRVCHVTISDHSARYVDISIRRIGVDTASGTKTYLIRHFTIPINRSWYRTDGLPYGCSVDTC